MPAGGSAKQLIPINTWEAPRRQNHSAMCSLPSLDLRRRRRERVSTSECSSDGRLFPSVTACARGLFKNIRAGKSKARGKRSKHTPGPRAGGERRTCPPRRGGQSRSRQVEPRGRVHREMRAGQGRAGRTRSSSRPAGPAPLARAHAAHAARPETLCWYSQRAHLFTQAGLDESAVPAGAWARHALPGPARASGPARHGTAPLWPLPRKRTGRRDSGDPASPASPAS